MRVVICQLLLRFMAPLWQSIPVRWYGVETAPNEIRKVSFDHLQEPDLEHELHQLQDRLRGDPALGGIVLHHFGSYRAWLRRSTR